MHHHTVRVRQLDIVITRHAKLGKIQGGLQIWQRGGGGYKNFEFLRDKNINFLEVLR